MPVYDQGYRRYEARHPLRQVRFWPIVREALRGLFVRKLVVAFLAAFLIVSWIPTLAGLVYLLVVARFSDLPPQFPSGGQVFALVLGYQKFLLLMLTVFVGAGLIANDLRTGAIVVYLSRPLTRRDYLAGKLLALLLPQLLVTLVPSLLLWAGAAAALPERFFTMGEAWIVPAIVAQSLLMCLTFAFACLAVSAVARSTWLAGLWLFGGLMVLELVAKLMAGLFGSRYWDLLSLLSLLSRVGNALFGVQESARELPWSLALAVLLAVAGGCLAVLRARVRAVEIVA